MRTSEQTSAGELQRRWEASRQQMVGQSKTMLLQGEQSVYKVFYISGAGHCQKLSQFSKAAVSFSRRGSGISLSTPERCGNTFPIQKKEISTSRLLPKLEKHNDGKAQRLKITLLLQPRKVFTGKQEARGREVLPGAATQRSGSGWRCRTSVTTVRLLWVATCLDKLPTRLRFLTQ